MVLVKRNKDGQKTDHKETVKGAEFENEEIQELKTSLFERYWFLKYAIVVFLAPAFLNYAALFRENKELLPPGQLYDVGWSQKLYMGCLGKGTPTVLFDAPTGMTSDAWTLIVPKLAKITKVCVYDRAGLGFSDRPFINRSETERNKDSKSRRGSPSTTEKMIEDFHQLFTASSDQQRPFILVGAELGAVNMRFYAQMFEKEIAGLVAVNPLVEGMFNIPDETWMTHWQSKYVSVLQTLQLSAAVGISRIALILGLMKTQIGHKHVGSDVQARQKHLMCKPAHLSSAVDEFYFANESLSQMRTLCRIKPFPPSVQVSVVSSSQYSTNPGSSQLNKAWATFQDHVTTVVHPGSERIQLSSSAESALFDHAETIAKVIERQVRKSRKESQHAVKQ